VSTAAVVCARGMVFPTHGRLDAPDDAPRNARDARFARHGDARFATVEIDRNA
jgi:hypothetical protein